MSRFIGDESAQAARFCREISCCDVFFCPCLALVRRVSSKKPVYFRVPYMVSAGDWLLSIYDSWWRVEGCSEQSSTSTVLTVEAAACKYWRSEVGRSFEQRSGGTRGRIDCPGRAWEGTSAAESRTRSCVVQYPREELVFGWSCRTWGFRVAGPGSKDKQLHLTGTTRVYGVNLPYLESPWELVTCSSQLRRLRRFWGATDWWRVKRGAASKVGLYGRTYCRTRIHIDINK
jgi:hypothetical protein